MSDLLAAPSSECATVTLDEFLEAPKEQLQGRLFLTDPDRVIRVEWRCKTRPEVSWLTCHSFIEAHLKDGARMRFQKFSNRGYVETILPMSEVSIEGKIYKDRCAAADNLSSKPLLATDLRTLAAGLGSAPYCVARSNCHHFARELWNSLVVESDRRSSYPDRVKSNMLRGAKRLSLDQISSTIARSDMLCVDYGSDDDDLEPDYDAGVHLSCRQEEGSRLSGEFSAPRSDKSMYNRIGRLMDFKRLLLAGAIYKFSEDVESDMVALTPPESVVTGEEDECEVWAAEWLTSSGEAAARLAERVTGVDLVTLLARLPERSSPQQSSEPMLQQQGLTGSLNSIFGAISSGGHEDELVQDMCFLVLQSAEELRIAIYAILKPVNEPGRRPRRLRLLSGNAINSDEGSFSYSIQDLPPASLGAVLHAADIAHQEQQALRTALVTGDFGFVTLQ